jgi:radical SAM PhpK family P-methyltransferase
MDNRLDCLIIGYNDVSFAQQEQRVIDRGRHDPERGMFMRDHLLLNGRRLPYMDAVNDILRRAGKIGADDYLHGGEVPNLAACYLASFLVSRGLSAEMVSLFNCEQDRITDLLATRRPRTVAITTTYYIMPYPVAEITQFIRERMPDTQIIVGGPLVSNMLADLDADGRDEVFSWMGADIYVRESQGEDTLALLAAAVRDGTDLRDVPNVYLPAADGRFRFTRARPEANAMDQCVVNWDLFAGSGLGATVHTRTARSCAFKCAFCDYPVRAGELTLASVEAIERELRQLDRLGVTQMVFIDDTFNVPGPRFKELCRMMARNDFGFRWYSFFRAATARDQETYDLMAASKCGAVFLGIEAGDDQILKNMHKVATVDRYRFGIEQLSERGIATFASFISGFPGETEQTVQSTIDFINSTQPTFFRTEPWWYNHRSPIHRQAEEFGLTGREYEWRHNTMDTRGAVDACQALFDNVSGSLWMPGYNFDFWALPYLFGKGIGLPEVVEFHRLARQVMPYNDTPGIRPPADALDRFYHVFDGVPPVAARYRASSRAAEPALAAAP